MSTATVAAAMPSAAIAVLLLLPAVNIYLLARSSCARATVQASLVRGAGESGAGKTFTTQKILDFLAEVCGSRERGWQPQSSSAWRR